MLFQLFESRPTTTLAIQLHPPGPQAPIVSHNSKMRPTLLKYWFEVNRDQPISPGYKSLVQYAKLRVLKGVVGDHGPFATTAATPRNTIKNISLDYHQSTLPQT